MPLNNTILAIPTEVKNQVADGDCILMIDPGGTPYKISIADFQTSLSSNSNNNNSGTSSKLIGTPFGASPSYSVGGEFDKAFDGDVSTCYNYAYSSAGYCGLDLGSNNTKKLTKIRIYPRQDSGVQGRSGGAKIQASNNPESGYIDLFTFPATSYAGVWYEGEVTVSTAYRYLRYYAVDGTYCSVAEVEFYGV